MYGGELSRDWITSVEIFFSSSRSRFSWWAVFYKRYVIGELRFAHNFGRGDM
jgi:hypothetical protein